MNTYEVIRKHDGCMVGDVIQLTPEIGAKRMRMGLVSLVSEGDANHIDARQNNKGEIEYYKRNTNEIVTKVGSDGLEDKNINALQAATANQAAAIANIKTTYYDTIATMKTDTTIQVGTTVITRGYTTVGDGGGGSYNIRAKNAGETSATNWSTHFLNNGLVAEIVINGSVNIHQMGAVGDGTTDDTSPFKRALTSGLKVIFNDNKTYLVNGSILSQFANQYLYFAGGNNTKIKLSNSIDTASRAYQIYVENSVTTENIVELENLQFEVETTKDSLGVEFTIFNIRNCKKLHTKNCKFICNNPGNYKFRLNWFWLRQGNFPDVHFEDTDMINMGGAFSGGLVWSYDGDGGIDNQKHTYKFTRCKLKCNSRDEILTTKNAFDLDVIFDTCDMEVDSLDYVKADGTPYTKRDMIFAFQQVNGVSGKHIKVVFDKCDMKFTNIDKSISIINPMLTANNITINFVNRCTLKTTATADPWDSNFIKHQFSLYTQTLTNYKAARSSCIINISDSELYLHPQFCDSYSTMEVNIYNSTVKAARMLNRSTSKTPISTTHKIKAINSKLIAAFGDTPGTLFHWLNQETENKCHYTDIFISNSEIEGTFINNPTNNAAEFTPTNYFTPPESIGWNMQLINNFVNGAFKATGYS